MRIISALLLAVALVLPSACKNRSEEAKKKKEAYDELRAGENEVKKSLEMTEEGLKVDHEALANNQKRVEAAAEKLGGKQGEALKILAKIQADSNKIAKDIDARSQEFIAALDWKSLESNADYDARRTVMRDYAKFNRETIEIFAGRPTELNQQLDDINFKGKEREDLEQGFNSSYGPMMITIRKIRECDIAACDISVRILNLLEKDKGKWSWNTADEVIDFENAATSAAFQKEIQAFQEVGELQIQLQTKLIQGL